MLNVIQSICKCITIQDLKTITSIILHQILENTLQYLIIYDFPLIKKLKFCFF